MRKFICFSLMLLLSIFILTGCSKSNSGAANLFSFNNKEVLVTLDLKDGWFVEFGINGTYLYDQVPNNDTKAVAYGVYVSKEDYNQLLDEYKKAKGYKEIENGIFFKEEPLSKYIIKISDDIYYEIIVEDNNYNANDVFKRFDVKLNNM